MSRNLFLYYDSFSSSISLYFSNGLEYRLKSSCTHWCADVSSWCIRWIAILNIQQTPMYTCLILCSTPLYLLDQLWLIKAYAPQERHRWCGISRVDWKVCRAGFGPRAVSWFFSPLSTDLTSFILGQPDKTKIFFWLCGPVLTFTALSWGFRLQTGVIVDTWADLPYMQQTLMHSETFL